MIRVIYRQKGKGVKPWRITEGLDLSIQTMPPLYWSFWIRVLGKRILEGSIM